MSFIYDGIWCLKLPHKLTPKQLSLHDVMYTQNLSARTDEDEYNDVQAAKKNFQNIIEILLNESSEAAARIIENSTIFSPAQTYLFECWVGHWNVIFNFKLSDNDAAFL